jgi:hypothetical protein
MSRLTSDTPPRGTLAVTCSRPNSEALVAHVVLAHLRVAFYLRMCGLCRGADAVIVH